VLKGFETRSTPREVTEQLLGGLETVADKAVIFSVRGKRLEGRTANRGLGGEAAVAELGFDIGTSSLLSAALDAGHAFGSLRDEPPGSALGSLLGPGTDPLYGARLDVFGRPLLVLLLAGLRDPAQATELVQRLLGAAGTALERILRSKKARN
jgi:hypothetical protein